MDNHIKSITLLKLADTTIRLYRKKDGKVSVKLRSYLLVSTNAGFRLSTYLKGISLELKFSSGEIVSFHEIAFGDDVECYELDTMVHDFRASAIVDMDKMQNTVGVLTLNYHVIFTGHPTEEPQSISYTVPIIKRSTVYEL